MAIPSQDLPQDVARHVARVAQDKGLYRQRPYAQGIRYASRSRRDRSRRDRSRRDDSRRDAYLERYQKKALHDGVATVPAVEAVEAAQAVCAAEAAQAQAEMPSHHHFKVLVHDWFPDILYMNL